MVSRMREGHEDDTLLLLEHPHVFTMGKAARPEDVLWNDDQRRSLPSFCCSWERGAWRRLYSKKKERAGQRRP